MPTTSLLATFGPFVTVQVYYEDCDTQLAVEDLLESGGCDCS